LGQNFLQRDLSGARSVANYDEDSIQILSSSEVADRFAWASVAALAKQYPTVPAAFIARGLTACDAVKVSREYFVRRYLQGDRTVTRREDVEAAFQALTR
jgi:hypothetical protein